jgi:hypothetical protein
MMMMMIMMMMMMMIPSYCIGNWNSKLNNLSNPSDTDADNDDDRAFNDDDCSEAGLFPKTEILLSSSSLLLLLLFEIISDLNCFDNDDDDDGNDDDDGGLKDLFIITRFVTLDNTLLLFISKNPV